MGTCLQSFCRSPPREQFLQKIVLDFNELFKLAFQYTEEKEKREKFTVEANLDLDFDKVEFFERLIRLDPLLEQIQIYVFQQKIESKLETFGILDQRIYFEIIYQEKFELMEKKWFYFSATNITMVEA